MTVGLFSGKEPPEEDAKAMAFYILTYDRGPLCVFRFSNAPNQDQERGRSESAESTRGAPGTKNYGSLFGVGVLPVQQQLAVCSRDSAVVERSLRGRSGCLASGVKKVELVLSEVHVRARSTHLHLFPRRAGRRRSFLCLGRHTLPREELAGDAFDGARLWVERWR